MDAEIVPGAVLARSRVVLEAAWDDSVGYCVPHPIVYPHLWLWDSCFHSLGWLGIGDDRAVAEVRAVFGAQQDSGFVPHMTYRGPPGSHRGPNVGASSFTQPPVYGVTISRLVAAGLDVPEPVLDSARRGLLYLRDHRLDRSGLLVVFHPWETGVDDSPRWDDWVGTDQWSRPLYTVFDLGLVAATHYDESSVACGSDAFASCSASFNGITAGSARALGELLGDDALLDLATSLGEAMDEHLWMEEEGLWADLPLIGGGPRQRVPTLDGLLGILATPDVAKAAAAIDQLDDPTRFEAPFGPRFLPIDHPAYQPDQYWRGPTWPQLNYLLWYGCHQWDRRATANALAQRSWDSVLQSGFAEYWNPEDGTGLGAIPQTWATCVAVMTAALAPAS